MAVVVQLLNGTNLCRDAGFQAEKSTILNAGVRKNYLNELEVTAGQVDTGMCFVTITRTAVTPNEVFKIPVWVTAATVVSTAGDGWIIVRISQTKINDGSSNAVDGTGIATIEKVAALPADPYLILATLAAGVITDAREWAQISENVLDDPLYYDEDAEANDDYVISIVGVKEYKDGQKYAFKANTANTGAATLNINSLGAKSIRKQYNAALATGDILAGQEVEVRYDADNDFMQMMSTPSTIASLAKATQSEAEAGTDDAAYMTSLKTAQSLTPRRTCGENIDGSTTPQAVHFSDGTNGRTAGRLYKSDADDTTNAAVKFDGFILENITTGNDGRLYSRPGTVIGGFVGLTIGRIYYVDTATAGGITLTNTGVPVGRAISATQIEILRMQKIKRAVKGKTGVLSNSNQTLPFSCGFRPRALEIIGGLYAQSGAGSNQRLLSFRVFFDGSVMDGAAAKLNGGSSAFYSEIYDPSTDFAILDDSSIVLQDGAAASTVTLDTVTITDTGCTIKITEAGGGSGIGSMGVIFYE